MASDMVVALARSTADGRALFGHNSNRPRGEIPALVRTPGREFSPGEMLALEHALVPQVRRTWTVLASRAARDWGYQHGVNEKGVAAGCTPIRTRLGGEAPGLTGPDLVRLALERATSACAAVEILTDLISRHGQGGWGQDASDSAFLLADAREAYVVEATGRYWVLAAVGSVRAVTGTCTLRQDWDRIARGLSDASIRHGWWPEDGCKLDFAGALGVFGPDHARDVHRWGQATLRLEQHSGQIDDAFVRELLRDQAELFAPADGPTGEAETAASLVVRLGPAAEELPVAWCAFAAPGCSAYIPVFVTAELPAVFSDAEGGSRLWQVLTRWQAETRDDPQKRAVLRSALAALQQHLDEHLREFLPEATDLHRRGLHDQFARSAAAFVQHCCERVEEVAAELRSPTEAASVPREEELVGAAF